MKLKFKEWKIDFTEFADTTLVIDEIHSIKLRDLFLLNDDEDIINHISFKSYLEKKSEERKLESLALIYKLRDSAYAIDQYFPSLIL
jgi:hypothetical protein